MALPRIEAVVTANTGQAEAGFDRVGASAERMGARARAAGTNAAMLGTQMGGVTRSSGRMRSAVQNASYQLSDMAIMMEMGIDTSRVMSQQLPQLLSGFGALGAVIGTVVAIGIPMAGAFKSMASEGEGLGNLFGTLTPMIEAMGSAMSAIVPIFTQAAEIIINNIDRIVITAGVAVSMFAAKWVGAFIAARLATFSLSAALVALRGALIRTGIGVLIVAAGEMVYQFTRLVQGAGNFGNAMGLLADVATEVWTRIKDGAVALGDGMKAVWLGVKAEFMSMVAGIQSMWSDMLYSMGSGISSIPGMSGLGASMMGAANNVLQGVVGSGGLNDVVSGLRGAAGDAAASAAGGFAGLGAPLESVQKIRDVLASIKDDRITLPDLLGVGGEDEEGEGGGGGGSGGKSAASKKLDDELTEQENRIRDHFDRIKALTTGGLSDKLGAWGDYFSNLVNLTGTQNEKLFRIAKAAKAGQALMDAWSAYNQVLADPSFIGRPWARAAAAGQVLAAGIGAVNAIKGVSSSGSGSSSSSGASSSTSTTAAAAPAPSPMLVQTSSLDGFITVETLYKLQDIAGDNGLTFVGTA